MIAKCEQCGSAFGIDDLKVENKKFAFTCPKCSTKNVFDNRKSKNKDIVSGLDDTIASNNDNPGTGEDGSHAGKSTQFMMEGAADDFDFLAGVDEGVKSPAGTESGSDSFFFGDIDEPFADVPELDAEPDGFSLDGISEPFADVQESGTELDGFSFDDIGEPFADVPELDAEPDGFSLDGISEPFADVSEPGTEPDGFSFDDIDESFADILESDTETDDSPISIEIEPEEFSAVTEDGEGFDSDDFLSSEFTDDILNAVPPLHEPDISLFEDTVIQEETAVDEFLGGAELESETLSVDFSDKDEGADEGFPIFDEDALPAFDWQNDIDAIDGEIADFSEKSLDSNDDDEDITIDLDSLDIDVEEPSAIKTTKENKSALTENEDVTLDLDALDIPIEENEELKTGLIPDDDEKFTLDDAGLTLDDLMEDSDKEENYFPDEVELVEYDDRLNIMDVDPSMKVGIDELEEAESILMEDAYEDEDDYGFEAEETTEKSVEAGFHGALLFSVDYSLKYSRLKAVLRLFMPLFLIIMLPHFLVMSVYSVLSLILGILNTVTALFTGKPIRDFLEIMEQTVRYFTAVQLSIVGIVDEFPVFAGKKDINHSLQMDIEYTDKSSRLLAFLRLTVVGIVVAVLPHLLICFIMACLLPVLFLMNSLCTIFTGTLPYALWDIVSRIYRYSARVIAFTAGLVDKYPPFSF